MELMTLLFNNKTPQAEWWVYLESWDWGGGGSLVGIGYTEMFIIVEDMVKWDEVYNYDFVLFLLEE